ncbi:MAG: DNA-binding protein, partial [Terrabacter sp.]
MSSSGRTTPARTLADQLRGWSDERLVALLAARPDLATPAPQDSSQLASRAATRSSIHRALDGLDRLELSVLDALLVAGQTTPAQLIAIVHADPDRAAAALQRLLDLALAWETPGGVRALSGVADAMRGVPGIASGLRPVSPEPLADAEVRARLAELSPAAAALLRHVDEHGGEGTTGAARRTVSPSDARSPAEELLSRRLLVPREGSSVVLPGEVGLALRGGRTTTEPVDDVPGLATSSRDASLVARSAAGAAFDVVRRGELLLDHWGVAPPSVLRSGGLAVRDLKAVARELHVDESEAALVVEVALSAGLIA